MGNLIHIGLIGCGAIARQAHLPVLRRAGGVRVAAVADAAPQQLPPGVPGFTDYRQLLDLPDIMAVVITAPTSLHAEIAEAAFARGKHVYLEKPLAISQSEADRVVSAWRRAGTVGMIGFNYRFNPLLAELREQVKALGQLAAARSVFSLAARAMPSWKDARSTGGGVLLDLASHHVDLARFLFGEEIVAVRATVRAVQREADTATLELRFASGCRLQSFFSWCAVEEDRWEIYGTMGKAMVNRYGGGLGYRLRKRGAPGGDPSYRIALEHFLQAVRRGAPAQPDFADGLQSLRVILAAEESAKSGLEVLL